jgi:Domain of unknown function (DUF1906)
MLTIDTDGNVSGHIALLKSKNVGAVGRYYSEAAWKRITKSEAQKIAAAQIKLFMVFENRGDSDLEGDAGTSDGQLALSQARSIGQPNGSAIYFALEHLPSGYTSAQIPGIKNYIQQIRAVIGDQFKVGVYSDGATLDALLASHLIDYAWLSASRGFDGSRSFYECGRWALAQDPHIDIDWEGIKIDLNETKDDFGQFELPMAAPLTAESRVRNVLLEDRFDLPPLSQSGSKIAEFSNIEPNLNNLALTSAELPPEASQRARVAALATKIRSAPEVLQYAKNIGTAVVDGPKNHCAATLSALLVFIGIFPNGSGSGSGDLQPAVVQLDWDLKHRRGWSTIPLGQQVCVGDVGVVMASASVHHIYLVVDAADQQIPLIADNQLSGVHARPVAGDPAKNFSPTNYFLRAPGQDG